MTISLPGKRAAFVGIGGGSDCVQAAMLALLSGTESCVISVRTAKPSSVGADGQTDTSRNVSRHGGMIAPDVYIITPETTGSGRFLEFLPARKLRTYLVIDQKDGRLSDKISAAVMHFGGVDTIVAVDTGGDCLYRSSINDSAKATPDQDIESLIAISKIKDIGLYSCVIANGVDAPPYAADILKTADAAFFNLSAEETRFVLDLYTSFKLDGSDPALYGKTPYAWQAALAGKRGRIKLPLPDHVIHDPVNPWDPYVDVTDDMAGFYLMDLRRHLAAIGK